MTNEFIKQQQELARERLNKEYFNTPRVRKDFCQFCDEVVLNEEVCDCETEVVRQHLLACIKDDVDTLIQQITTNIGVELMRRVESKRKPLVHDVNWAEGYNAAIDTIKQHITSVTGVE